MERFKSEGAITGRISVQDPNPSKEPTRPTFEGLMWRWHNGKDRRVWSTIWSGDTFEIMEAGKFEELQYWCTKFGIPLNEAED